MQQELSKPEPPKKGNKFAYCLMGIITAVWAYLMFRRTVQIALDAAASWYLELFVLAGAGLLLFTKSGGHERRFILEATLFMAALMVFIAKFALGKH